MSTAMITFDIDGQTVNAEDAVWYQVAPCGCTCGAMVTVTQVRAYLNEDDAWTGFYRDAPALMARDKAAGFLVELGLRAEVTDRMRVSCGHDPEWGVPVVERRAQHDPQCPSALRMERVPCQCALIAEVKADYEFAILDRIAQVQEITWADTQWIRKRDAYLAINPKPAALSEGVQ